MKALPKHPQCFRTMRRILLSLFALINNNDANNNNQSFESISSSKATPTTTTTTTVRGVDATTAASRNDVNSCRSNATHIVWIAESTNTTATTNTTTSCSCSIQTRSQAEQDCLLFLQNNLMGFDIPFRETMGFPIKEGINDSTHMTIDGLDYGMIQPTIRLALDAKVQYPWTDTLPKHIFMDYVLNYANLNEARTNWRPLLVHALKFNESDFYTSATIAKNISSVTTWVNTHLWTKLARHPDHPISFQPSQTPLIFDPMSTIAFGYASCTGTSILLCNALRSVGIPARVAGTPAWYGNATLGNHNWIEVYVGKIHHHQQQQHQYSNIDDDDGDWKFLEPSPGLANVDSLDADPCQRWFCDPSRFPSSKVYAAKLSRNVPHPSITTNYHHVEEEEEDSNQNGWDNDDDHRQRHQKYGQKDMDNYFPLAWEWSCHDVPAIDRTDYYAKICGHCHQDEL